MEPEDDVDASISEPAGSLESASSPAESSPLDDAASLELSDESSPGGDSPTPEELAKPALLRLSRDGLATRRAVPKRRDAFSLLAA